MSEAVIDKTEPFTLKKLNKKIKWYVEKGIKKGKADADLHTWATSKVNDWIDMFYPEQAHLKG